MKFKVDEAMGCGDTDYFFSKDFVKEAEWEKERDEFHFKNFISDCPPRGVGYFIRGADWARTYTIAEYEAKLAIAIEALSEALDFSYSINWEEHAKQHCGDSIWIGQSEFKDGIQVQLKLKEALAKIQGGVKG